jgi:hypothetical protein
LSVLRGRWCWIEFQSNTNGHARQTTTEGAVPEAACAIKALDSSDDGPIGPKPVEIDKKPRL